MIFDSERTKAQLKAVRDQGLQQSEPYWDFGYPILNETLCDSKRGLWFIVAPENVGKSMFQINLGYNVLKSNEKGYWLDFSLDDSVEDRLGYLLACTGDLPISLIRRAGDAPEDQKQLREQAIVTYFKKYGSRYCLMGVSDDEKYNSDDIYDVNRVVDRIRLARQQLNDVDIEAKLFVTIDSFHDLNSPGHSEELSLQKYKSQLLKRCASETNSLILLSAHTRKDSRRRSITADVMKGEDTPAFDCKVISHLYSDVNLNRDTADIWWEDHEQPNKKLPIHELDILKNKWGSEKKVIFYNYMPSRCWDYEVC
ncbi:MAG TPA: hypothetical protein VEP90_12495, partial [Methylomirabilota bacterium]|nr:hypothetical protein [Methylomirabilota bacterium]